MSLLPRFLRWTLQAEGLNIEVDKADWGLLSRMGSGVEEGLKAAGIQNYADAVVACQVVAPYAAPGARYNIDDLVSFLCLSQNREVVCATEFPPRPLPVSVFDVLGLEKVSAKLQRRDIGNTLGRRPLALAWFTSSWGS